MPKPSRAEFLEHVAELLARRYPDARLAPDPDHFALKIDDHTVSLENLYRLAADEGDDLPRHVERWVGELMAAAEKGLDLSSTFAELRQRIMPVVMSSTRKEASEYAMVRQGLLEGLDVAYAVDAEKTISYLPRRLFDTWEVDVDELHEVALENLLSKSEQIAAQADQDEEGNIGLIMIQTLDGYDASRILLPSLHEKLREHLGSPFVAGIPNRDILLCFRDDAETVTRLRGQIQDMHRNMPHQVTEKLFLVTADGIAPYSEAQE